ncbi:MAG: hypothetical protein CL731_09720 [Chloroflexi bacterium]|nr:hypothetical protein [Chloroflexota bacterium]
MGHLRKYGESPTDQLTTESEELVLDYEIKFQRPNGSWEPTGIGGSTGISGAWFMQNGPGT